MTQLKVEVVMIDRKSTRLNSSHQIISYAVFCLKKKSSSSGSQRGEVGQGVGVVLGDGLRAGVDVHPVSVDISVVAVQPQQLDFFFFFNDTATTEIYTPFPTRRSSDLLKKVMVLYMYKMSVLHIKNLMVKATL